MAAGARTQLVNLVAAVFCFLTLGSLTPLFRDMPHPALAAIPSELSGGRNLGLATRVSKLKVLRSVWRPRASRE